MLNIYFMDTPLFTGKSYFCLSSINIMACLLQIKKINFPILPKLKTDNLHYLILL